MGRTARKFLVGVASATASRHYPLGCRTLVETAACCDRWPTIERGIEIHVKVMRRVVVFDASDIEAESSFWAGLLGGTVHRDEGWHSIVVDGDWVMGVQHAPNHVAPVWPSGPQQQQVHLDLHVDDLEAAGRLAEELGGRQLQAARRPADNPGGDESFAVYASPAGHPFCFGVY